jgi:predicted RecA/RadA family phage recombinase
MSTRIQTERQASFLATAPAGGWVRDQVVAVQDIVGVVWETAAENEQVYVCYRAEKALLPVAGADGLKYPAGSVVYYDTNPGGTLTDNDEAGTNPKAGIVLVQPANGDANAYVHLMGDMGA